MKKTRNTSASKSAIKPRPKKTLSISSDRKVKLGGTNKSTLRPSFEDHKVLENPLENCESPQNVQIINNVVKEETKENQLENLIPPTKTPVNCTPCMRSSEMSYLMPKTVTQSDLLKRLGLPANVSTTSPALSHVRRVLSESREIEGRIQDRLKNLKFAAERMANDATAPEEEKKENDELKEKLGNYDEKMEHVKSQIKDILAISKQTQDEIKHTKEIVNTIQQDQSAASKIMAQSFHSRYLDECDDEMFPQTDQIMESNKKPMMDSDYESIKILQDSLQKNASNEEENDYKTRISELEGMVREYEMKVLQSESERIKKERENIDLKESVITLKRLLAEKVEINTVETNENSERILEVFLFLF